MKMFWLRLKKFSFCLALLLNCCAAPNKLDRQTTTKSEKLKTTNKKPAANESVNKPKYLKNADDTLDFTVSGEGIASKYERKIEAEKRAEDNALNMVVKESGVNIYSGFTDVSSQQNNSSNQFVSSYLQLFSRGLVAYNRSEEPKFVNLDDGGTKCFVTIKGKINFNGEPDAGYEIVELKMNQPVYYEGDKVEVVFKVTRDSYVHLLVSDEKQNTYLVYPNKYAQPAKLKAGTLFNFPGGTVKGLELKALLPGGASETVEILHVIATKDQPLFIPEESREINKSEDHFFEMGQLQDIFKRLWKLNREDWTTEVVSYSIRKR
ncbi:MAG: DUF4384 domain-containing protein [Elusimicrobiota bacterium]